MITPRITRFGSLAIGFFVVLTLLLSFSSHAYPARADDVASSTPQTTQTNATTTPSSPDVQTEVASSTNGTGGAATTTGGTIQTGDAVATSSIQNDLNTNQVNPDGPGGTNNSNIVASTTNDGALGSTASSTADTGSNTVVGGEGANTIVTGNAVATANVINEVNTNIFNSQGLVLFLNQLFGKGINLNDYDLSFFFAGGKGTGATMSQSTPPCTLLTCLNNSNLNVFNTNNAKVTNAVIVHASTGDNTASSTGNATISTGDAYAAANVVNLVNTNIINSSYLLMAFNNFGDLNDNVTLPDDTFFTKLLASGGREPNLNSSTYTLQDTNVATTTGTVVAGADTGGNVASTTNAFVQATSTDPMDPNASTTPTTGNGVVTTGAAHSSASSFNEINTNSVGGTSVFMLFRVMGTWNGTVHGLPAGMSWSQTPDGIEIVSNNSTPPIGTLGNFLNSTFLASSTNTAALDNNVSVAADTGHNKATTDVGTSSVATGNAYAVANVVNLVNTDIVGQNWIFAIFNIFGNWNGDIQFGGSPNLAVTVLPSVDTTPPNSDVTYTFTVTNSGTGDANDALLNASFDNTLLTFASGSQPNAVPTPTGASWNLGVIPHGQTRTFSFTGHIGTNFPAGQTATVPLTAAVVNNNITSPGTSNTATASIVVSAPASASGGGGGGGGSYGGGYALSNYTADPKVGITKTVSVATTSATTSVDYKVVVTNEKNAGPAYNSLLTDTLSDPAGNVMYERSWDLSTIFPGDEITLTYSVVYSATSTPGLYTNVAKVTGYKNYSAYTGGNIMSPIAATGTVQFTADGHVLPSSASVGMVLGTSTATTTDSSCNQFLSGFLRLGAQNSKADVFKLQVFLNARGENLTTTAMLDNATVAAVKRFQTQYAQDILTPLNLKKPTGSVMSNTQRKINALACNPSTPFTLTPAQTLQVAAYGNSIVTKANSVALPRKITVMSASKTIVPPAKTTAIVQASSAHTGTSGKSKNWTSFLLNVFGR